MNKKILAGMGISGAIMLGSMYSISANTSGYDLYKGSLKQTHAADSATLHMKLSLEDNQHAIFSADALYKGNMQEHVSTISTQLANETEKSNLQMFKQDGNWYVVKEGVDEIYKMKATANPHGDTGELLDDVENLIDVMTKNLQQQITVSEKKNGSHTIELDLSGKEIPLTANALSTLMIKHAVMLQDQPESNQEEFHIKPTMPELDHGITIKQVKLAANVDKENYIDQQTFEAVVSGIDKRGKSHELHLNLKMNVTDYNHTSVAPIKIQEDKVKEIDMNHGHSGK